MMGRSPQCYIQSFVEIGLLVPEKIFEGFLPYIVRTKNQKSRLVLTVQAFCEEKGLRSLSGVFGYAESKNQCWQVEKWLFIDLICIFSRWPPKTMELALY